MKDAKKNKQLVKIVYFDEGSATDFIYVLAGGKQTDREEQVVQKAKEIAVGAEAEANTKWKVLSVLSANLGADAAVDLSRESSRIITKAIENTILTDFISNINGKGKQYIESFYNCILYPYPDSFAYYKMLTPYLAMTDGSLTVGEDLNINLSLIDKALDSGRGYYELIAENNRQKSVLRFNIKAFRNNYSISDLVKMKLDYYAIEVGTVSPSNLTMKSEFGRREEREISGYDLTDSIPQTNLEEYKVYDVILAGVAK